jgi:hypothetical protein
VRASPNVLARDTASVHPPTGDHTPITQINGHSKPPPCSIVPVTLPREYTTNGIKQTLYTDSDPVCTQCNRETSGAHRCDCCNKPIHVMCGIQIGEDWGYGSLVRCKLCNVAVQEVKSAKATYASSVIYNNAHSKSLKLHSVQRVNPHSLTRPRDRQ